MDRQSMAVSVGRLRAVILCVAQNEDWRGLRDQQVFTPIFKERIPARMSRVPPAQRREALTEDEEKRMRSTLQKLMDARGASEEARADIWRCVDLLCSKVRNQDGHALRRATQTL